MKTHDNLRWDFKQETELDSVYRQNNNSQPFNEAYVKWLEDKVLLANVAEQSASNCNIPLVSVSEARAEVCECSEQDAVEEDGELYCLKCGSKWD